MWWNEFWVCLLLFSVLIGGGFFWAASAHFNLKDLRMSTSVEGSLHFSSTSDGPFVLTHLIAGDGSKGCAVFRKPLLFRDSRGMQISRKEMDALQWLDLQHQVVSAPKDTSRISAVYYRAGLLKDKHRQ